jgi:putative nucleotidyltransferase with HDIG domain
MKMDTELFNTITKHLMLDEKPSDYLNQIFDSEEFKQQPYSMLRRLKETKQSKLHHPEGNVWNHTILVLDEAAKVRNESSNPKAFLWAALLHDIGKPDTTRIKGEKVTAYNHDNIGAELTKKFLQAVTDDQDLIMEVYHLVKYHMHMLYILKKLPFGDYDGLISSVDIHDIALLGFCDRLGRTGVNRDEVREDYQKFLTILEDSKKETLSIH